MVLAGSLATCALLILAHLCEGQSTGIAVQQQHDAYMHELPATETQAIVPYDLMWGRLVLGALVLYISPEIQVEALACQALGMPSYIMRCCLQTPCHALSALAF